MNKKDKSSITLTLSNFLGMALRDQSDDFDIRKKKNGGDDTCCVCEEIDEDAVVALRNCTHAIHVHCAESIFQEAKNKCPICKAVLLEGFEMAINPKYKPKNGHQRARSGKPPARNKSIGREKDSQGSAKA